MIRSVEITGSTRTGVIAAPDNRAADAGVAILRRGGNAVDAAVAGGYIITAIMRVNDYANYGPTGRFEAGSKGDASITFV